MVNGCVSSALRQVARVFQEGTFTGLSDPQILERFVDGRDEAAFEALLVRHGPMVLNVCRQLLRDPHDAEDAFQAVFLVLVRKAGSIRLHDSLGPWLYTVAGRVAARARANRRRMREREVTGGELPELPANGHGDFLEDARVVHEELGRLPERLRAPLVLCYLEGLTHELAARQLGCPVGTVHSRLSRARGLLQKRISRRGLAVSTAALGSLLGSNAMAGAVPSQLRMSLIKAVTQWMPGSAVKGGIGISVSVTTLLEGVLNVIRIKKLAMVAMGVISVGAVVFVAAEVGRTQPPAEPVPIENELVQGIGPDGRVISAFVRPSGVDRKRLRRTSVDSNPSAFAQIYDVGDIVSRLPAQPSGIQPGSNITERPKVDVTPIIELITSTVAPGTWRVDDGSEISSKIEGGHVGQTNPIGSITPFYLGISLIIKCAPETHKDIGTLLRGLRNVIYLRDRQKVAIPGTMEPTELELGDPSAAPKAIQVEPTYGPALIPAKPSDGAKPSSRLVSPPTSSVVPASWPRVRELLDELRQEIEKAPPDHN